MIPGKLYRARHIKHGVCLYLGFNPEAGVWRCTPGRRAVMIVQVGTSAIGLEDCVRIIPPSGQLGWISLFNLNDCRVEKDCDET